VTGGNTCTHCVGIFRQHISALSDFTDWNSDYTDPNLCSHSRKSGPERSSSNRHYENCLNYNSSTQAVCFDASTDEPRDSILECKVVPALN
jgi:hypothetical protein